MRPSLGIRVRRTLVRLLPWTAALLLPGCASSWRGPRTLEETAISRQPFGERTVLDRRLDRQRVGAPAGTSGVASLATGEDALYARLAMIELAGRSIDVQTYIWDLDHSGRLILGRLLAAADRGVRVRVLLDDTATFRNERMFAALDRHPNFQVRLFNPFRTRPGDTWVERTIEFIADFRRLNRRMHNKQWIFDGGWTIVGGRNVADHYFLLAEDLNFRDLDLLAAGPVAADSSAAFDRYWNSRWAVPIEELAHARDRRLERARQALERFEAGQERIPYASRPTPETAGAAFDRIVPELFWAPVELLVDDPGKIGEAEQLTSVIAERLRGETALLGEELLVEVAYLALPEATTDELARLVERGVRVRVLTNSLATNDVVAAHSGYVSTRRRLLEAGVELHELRPGGHDDGRFLRPSRRSRASLHSKVLVFDRRHLFVGSLNLDPRSVVLNTEIGLFVDAPPVAAAVAARLERGYDPAYSWKVELEAQRVRTSAGPIERQRVVWTGDPERPLRTREPRASTWRRLLAWLLARLPLESQV